MRFTERLTRLKEWATKELCEGRVMKAPGKNMNIGEIRTKEPECYLGWAPARIDPTGKMLEDTTSTVPGIIIMPNQAHAKYMEERRFDRYNNVHRPSMMGQHLSVAILFMVYEPGIRLPGFVESMGERGQGLDMTKITDGTEQGLFTLIDWMNDCMEKLLAQKSIPNTDLWVEEETITFSLYSDQQYVVDRRPVYYGFVNVSFGCHADEGTNPVIDQYLI